MNILEWNLRAALWFQDAPVRGWVAHEFCHRADGTCHELTAAIRAPVGQLFFGAGAAKGAFKAANDGVHRRRRQVLVAAFAIGTKFKHPCPEAERRWPRVDVRDMVES